MGPPSRGVASLIFCVLILRAQAPAQEVVIRTHSYTPPSTILHAESNLVEAGLTVRDSQGRAVAGLHASDLEVRDNGVSQKITAFSELRADAKPGGQPPEPKFVTFFFDDLHLGNINTGNLDLPFVKQAARKFIAKGLKPSDLTSIVTTSGAGDLDFTNDATLFAEKLEHLNLHTHVIHSIEEYQADSVGTLAGLGAAAKRLSEAPGQRILVLMSSGFIIHVGNEHDVEPQVQEVINTAVRWNVVIHAIDAKGLTPAAPRTVAASNRPLREITQGTGGHLFENTNDLAGSMELAANPEVTYLLAFNPGSHDGKFHTLKIRFKSKRGNSIQFRPGYLSRTDDSEKALTARAPLDDAVFSKQTLRDVPATVALAGGQPKDGTIDGTKEGMIPVSIGITVDVNGLQFSSANGRHMQQIVFLMTLLDAHGGFVTGKESIMDLALTDEKLASLKKDGLKTITTLNAPAGIYQVRTIVREGMKGGLTTSTAAVELRAK
jgi:VWFA-related protein